MPWKAKNVQEQRYELVRALSVRKESISHLCRRWRVSRKTGYKWLLRYKKSRLRGLVDAARRPRQVPRRTAVFWLARLRRLRRGRPTWGARKLHYQLGQEQGTEGLPAVSTLSRWLKRWGLARGRRRRGLGPRLTRPAVRAARQANETWTVDFKGWYRTGDGSRVDPLTVRDLHSRYVLRVALLKDQSVAIAKAEFRRIFRRYGLPRRIRCDNGPPFGGGGPTGLTRLSAWWIKLGIEVEFITPGRPCENGGHEQMHRIFQKEVVKNAAMHPAEEQRRSNR